MMVAPDFGQARGNQMIHFLIQLVAWFCATLWPILLVFGICWFLNIYDDVKRDDAKRKKSLHQ
jgi:hypothetical protein